MVACVLLVLKKKDRHKFSQRAQKSLFLGYSSHKKGYKVYNIERNIEITSKDVIFHERVFPYQILSTKKNNDETKTFFLPENPNIATTNINNNRMYDTD